jgi:hypothetical protein
MKNTYKNRYGDEFTFTRDENHDILWEGNFKYSRIGMPNDYTRAYEAYLKDSKELFASDLNTFDFLTAYRMGQNQSVIEYSDLLNAAMLVNIENNFEVLYFEQTYFK